MEQKKLFIELCAKLVEAQERGELSEEEAARQMVEAGLSLPDRLDRKELAEIFDLAGDVEIPRTSSYRQGIGLWNKETADKLKQKEWRQLVEAITKAGKNF